MNPVDCIVIGAGPAGCAAASMLARCGRRTLLINRPPTGRAALAESIPPSANRLLLELGMKNAVDAAGFEPWLGNTVWWGSDAPRVESFASGATGYQVERDRFDEVLRAVAVKAGAEILTGLARDVRVARLGGEDLEPALLTIDIDGKLRELNAAMVLDCSGRAGVVAGKGFRQHEASHHTVALSAIWRAQSPWPDAPRGHTLVASHADGWAWSVPTDEHTRYITVMVDPQRSHLTRDASALDVYRAELAKVAPFASLLERASLLEGPFGAHSSPYTSSRFAGEGFLLVGDAGSFIDPLSSFGVKKALASGWLAAITANTILETPSMTDEARAFYEERERAIVESFRKQTAGFAAETTLVDQHPFWEARAEKTTSEVVSSIDFGSDLRSLARDPEVLAAFDDLKRRPVIHLMPGDRVRTALRAAVRGRSIVLEDHLFLPAWPEGVRYLRNIDLLLMLKLAPQHTDVGEMYDAMFKEQPGISLPDFLGALSTLIAKGGLEHTRLSL
jgi:flavin-dependent dehydrogenase